MNGPEAYDRTSLTTGVISVALPTRQSPQPLDPRTGTMLAGFRLASAALAALALCFAIAPGSALHIRNNASPVTIPFARRVNATGVAKLLEVDRARAKSLKTGTRAAPTPFQQNDATSVPVTNQAVDYVMTVSPVIVLQVF